LQKISRKKYAKLATQRLCMCFLSGKKLTNIYQHVNVIFFLHNFFICVPNIVLMISNELMMLIVIAFLVASPIAYYGMSKWLQDFTCRVDVSVLRYSLRILALLIAMVTVSYQAIKAAI